MMEQELTRYDLMKDKDEEYAELIYPDEKEEKQKEMQNVLNRRIMNGKEMKDYDDDLIYDGLNGNEYEQDEYQEQFKWSSEIIYLPDTFFMQVGEFSSYQREASNHGIILPMAQGDGRFDARFRADLALEICSFLTTF